MSLKRKILIDGEELTGLVETSELKDEKGVVEVPGFERKIDIPDGVKKFAPLECIYKIQRDTNTQKVLRDWFYKNEYHDVTIINTDGTGAEVNRWLLRDCENRLYNERQYNAGGVEFFGVGISITCSSIPTPL
jgi:hypothetical protein